MIKRRQTLLEKQEEVLEYIEGSVGRTKREIYANFTYSRGSVDKALDELLKKEAISKKIVGRIHWYHKRKDDRRIKKPTDIEKAWGVEVLRS